MSASEKKSTADAVINPCPFCGSASIERVERDTGEKIIHFYGCTNCNALGPDARDVEQALARWNLRMSGPVRIAEGEANAALRIPGRAL